RPGTRPVGDVNVFLPLATVLCGPESSAPHSTLHTPRQKSLLPSAAAIVPPLRPPARFLLSTRTSPIITSRQSFFLGDPFAPGDPVPRLSPNLLTRR
ncbi:hypothetical protein J6590_056555, partial [Homalodisca vitripennis]